MGLSETEHAFDDVEGTLHAARSLVKWYVAGNTKDHTKAVALLCGREFMEGVAYDAD